jgi:SAM-dependent methyltransferase
LDDRAALHERFSTNPQGWFAWVFDQLACRDGARILEVGCGPGVLWQHNAERLERSWEVYLSDFSHGMVAEAKSRLDALGIRFYLSSDARALPFPDAHFDAVIANHMLYHVPDIGRALSEVRRVLRPGAKLYAATNGRRHLQEMAQFVSTAKSEQGGETSQAFWMSIRNFDLETGTEALGRWFSRVEVRRYPDSLRVTDVEAIVRYVQSSPTLRVTGPALGKLRCLLRDEMQRRGAITISKDPGLLMGTKPNGA